MPPISRRNFLKTTAATAGLTILNPWNFTHAQLFGLFGGKGQETPPITANTDFYVTSYDITPDVTLDTWTLNITGMVKHPLTLRFADLAQRPQTQNVCHLGMHRQYRRGLFYRHRQMGRRMPQGLVRRGRGRLQKVLILFFVAPTTIPIVFLTQEPWSRMYSSPRR